MNITRLVFFILFLIVLQGCKINQKQGVDKIGKWIYKTQVHDTLFELVKGRYSKDGFQKGTWKTKWNGKLYKKEKIKQSDMLITYYYPNRKIAQKGKAKIVYTLESTHFYYHGNWISYDTLGRINQIKNFKYGKLTHLKNIKHD
ncbi:hypothetical protein [Myroides sp. LJL119]